MDSADGVWLIDFGGGFTNGWVEAEQRETKPGDLGAVKKLRGWLEGPSCGHSHESCSSEWEPGREWGCFRANHMSYLFPAPEKAYYPKNTLGLGDLEVEQFSPTPVDSVDCSVLPNALSVESPSWTEANPGKA